jgi:hypothetical protein
MAAGEAGVDAEAMGAALSGHPRDGVVSRQTSSRWPAGDDQDHVGHRRRWRSLMIRA